MNVMRQREDEQYSIHPVSDQRQQEPQELLIFPGKQITLVCPPWQAGNQRVKRTRAFGNSHVFGESALR